MQELEPVYLSKEGLKKLKDELHHLKTEKRREVAFRIEKAKELGDLSENAEYHEAKEQLSFVEGRIMELKSLIPRAVLIGAAQSDSVAVGSKVLVGCEGREKSFTIVGSQEADPLGGLISNESPTGQALLGCKVGEDVEVKIPSGTVRYTIKSIS